jgi:hypothetical protein
MSVIRTLAQYQPCTDPSIAPRWLLLHGRDEKAVEVLTCLKRKRDQADESTVANEVAEIKLGIARESEATRWKDLLKDDKVRSRRRVFIAVMIQTLQAFSGSTPINYYTTIM